MPQIVVGETSVEEKESGGSWEPRGTDVRRELGTPGPCVVN